MTMPHAEREARCNEPFGPGESAPEIVAESDPRRVVGAAASLLRRAEARKHVILFLAANPPGTSQLALDREARAIHQELQRSGYRDRFEFVTRWAVEPLDLLRELRDLKPTVVHFSGQGAAPVPGASWSAILRGVVVPTADDEPQGLILHDAAGSARIVSLDALAHAFEAAGASVKLVVLNACFTEPIAEALLAHVDCVVGMSGAIHDDAARIFAIGFYGGLGEHESVAAAYAYGRAALHLEGLPDAARPRLKVRGGCDATGIILAAVAPVLRQNLPCPYPGMRPYTADDADRFHGRAKEIHDLLGRLRAGEREIYVIGPSGSGKSSLVTAGALRQLARGVSGMAPFVVRDLRPGEQPATRLGEALGVPPGQPWAAADCIATLLVHRALGSSVLLLIDQLEELFTLSSAQERTQFLAALRDLQREPRCAVIFTLRADFFGALLESPLWTEHKGEPLLIKVSPLYGEMLRDAIASPARDLGVVVEPELIERLLADAAAEPGILPLLQETLVQLWDQRQDQTLTLDDYQALGDGERSGLAIALAHRADAALRPLTPTQKAIARRILLRLISFGEGRSDTRRQQPRSRLLDAADNAVDFAYVLQQLIEHRLLTSDQGNEHGEPLIDLGHEIMISAWPTFADWIRTHRVDEQRRRQFEEAAVQHGRGARGLLDPIELAEAENWQRTESAVQLGQSAAVMGLIAASRTAQTKQRRRRHIIVGVVGLLALVAVAIAAAALAARDLANRNRKLIAQSYEEAGRQFLIDQHFQEAIPYLLAARRRGEDSTPLRMMFREAQRHLPLIPALDHQAPVVSATFSLDGTRVVTASRDQTARVWDATTGKPIAGPLEHQGQVLSAAFSPDGSRVVTASMDHTARVWDATTGKPLSPPLEHHRGVVSAAFSPDGTRVVTASEDKTARVWEAATGKPLTGPLEHRNGVVSAAFSPDGSLVVTASWDQTARVWDATTGKPISGPLEHQARVVSAVFSLDGSRVVTASEDKTVRVWDATTGKPLSSPLELPDGVACAFSADATRVVIANEDYTARVWDVITGKPLSPPLKHQARVVTAAFSLDGSRVVTASEDKTARVWDVATGKPLSSPLDHQAQVVSTSFSHDGARVVTASEDKTARVWDAATGKPLFRPLTDYYMLVVSAAFSPDGTRVVAICLDFRARDLGVSSARVWDPATGKLLFRPLDHRAAVRSAAFSPDSARVVTASDDHTARVWDATTGKPLTGPLEHQARVESAAFSPDGARIVTASFDGTARVWDAATGKPLTGSLKHRAQVVSAAFSPDGSRIVTASFDGTARVFDAATGEPVIRPLEHQGPVMSAAFSPDGSRIVTASLDHTARVWDAATGSLLASLLEHQGPVVSAAFSLDGTRVVTASGDHTARVWDAATGKPLTSAFEHVESAAFSPDGTCVVTASRDTTARVWDAVTGKPISSPLTHYAAVGSAAFSPDGTRIITAPYDSAALVWDVGQDIGTLDEWSAVAERSPFVVNDRGVLLRRSPPRVQSQAR